jgi:alpha-mannosidase
VRTVERVVSRYGSSTLREDYVFTDGLPYVDVRVTVDWREQFKLLKLTFPLNLNFLKATYEIPYGHIERATNGEEEPGQSWIDLSGVERETRIPYGLSILNDAKYSFDIRGHDLGLTVLRSPIYAHHDPRVPEPDGRFSYLDQGVQTFTYALLPHADGWAEAGTVRRAAELNQRAIALVESGHDGPLAQRASFAAVDAENVVISALKRAEDGDDLIVRCYETAKRPCAARIELPGWGRVIEASFGPCEIKTFRVPRDERQPIVETDLIEWELADR